MKTLDIDLVVHIIQYFTNLLQVFTPINDIARILVENSKDEDFSALKIGKSRNR